MLLYQALTRGDHDEARRLVREGLADPNRPSTRARCLEYALGHLNDIEPFELLVGELGCAPADPSGLRLLDLVLFGCGKSVAVRTHLVERLLALGLTRVDAHDANGDGALHYAAMRINLPPSVVVVGGAWDERVEHAEPLVARLLRAAGADPLRANLEGRTPLDVWRAHRRGCSAATTTAAGDTDEVEDRLCNAMAEARERLDLARYAAFVAARRLGASLCDCLLRPLVVVPQPRGLMTQRRALLERQLLPLVAVPGGSLHDCLRGRIPPPLMLQELRLDHHIATPAGAEEYALLVRGLAAVVDPPAEASRGIRRWARAVLTVRLADRGIRFETPPASSAV